MAAPAAASADAVTGPVSSWVPDGEVTSLAVSGSTAFLGGNFSRLAPYTGSSARFDAGTGALKGAWPEVEGVVRSVVSDGTGGWYLGGDFRAVGGAARDDLAHIRADGTLDPDWAPTTNGNVRALAVGGGVVVAGGEFSAANGAGRTNLAAFDAASGALTAFTGAVTALSPFDPPGVYALVLSGATLYVGGEFERAQGANTPVAVTRNRGAAFTISGPNTSNLLPWDPNTNRIINSLASTGSSMFIAGRFSKANSTVDRPAVAEVDLTNAVLTAWVPPLQPATDLRAMTILGSQVYIAGTVRVSPVETWPAASFGTTNAALNVAWHPTPAGFITSLASAGSTIYIGSYSSNDGPQPALAGVDATNASPTGFAPVLGRGRQALPSGSTGGVLGIGVSGSDVVAGGTFLNVGGVARRNLAAIDLNTGQPTAFDPPMNGAFSPFTFVRALALTSDGLVWAGGDFATAGPSPRQYLAAFDATTGTIADFNRAPDNSPVSALAASGSTVWAGGNFATIGGMTRHNVAAVTNVPGEAGTVLPFDADANGSVNALALAGDTLYLGGSFMTLNGALASHKVDRHRLGAVNSTSGDALAWNPDADGTVSALALSGDTVYAGGAFANVNGSTARQRLAAFDTGAGTARSWAPDADAAVRTLAVYGTNVFAGGDFANVAGSARSGIAALDSQTGALDPFNPTLSTEDRTGPGLPPRLSINALAVSNAGLPNLLTGGTFVRSAPTPRAANLGIDGLTPFTVPGPGPGTGDPGPLGAPVTPSGPPARDLLAPTLALSASRLRFRVGPKRMPATGKATQAAKRKVPRGTTLKLRLSEAASVRFQVFVKAAGRKVGKRCVRPTRKNRKRARCTRLVLKGGFSRTAPIGRSKVVWSGRIRNKALKPGRYTLRATPTDTARNRGKARTLQIRIVR